VWSLNLLWRKLCGNDLHLLNIASANLDLLAVDLELTSLQVEDAEITSIGWVAGKANSVILDSSYYRLIKSDAQLGQSPIIHGLTPDLLNKGEGLNDVVEALRSAMLNHVLVFHNAMLDLAVLNKIFVRYRLPKIEVVYFDTLKLALYLLEKRHTLVPQRGVSLSRCRARAGLPKAPAHNALDDALATLELCFAQQHEMGLTKEHAFNRLIHTHAIGWFTLGK
jgi:DNA polymerase-3 subunit epsilon|tara:strand:+ start:15790 stop:16458 length:669 start_codon:yes stop_codon:yes gene_type:complete